jgi:hypothetical protein
MIFLTNKERYAAVKQLVTLAHKNQKDKAGEPYIWHLERVSNRCKTLSAKIVGLCHDLTEDEHMTHKELQKTGLLTGHELFCVALLDKKHEFPYFMSPVMYIEGYFPKIKSIPIAREVKIQDLKDNMDISRLVRNSIPIDEKVKERMQKYDESLRFLEGGV